jgi:hypothetical protein
MRLHLNNYFYFVAELRYRMQPRSKIQIHYGVQKACTGGRTGHRLQRTKGLLPGNMMISGKKEPMPVNAAGHRCIVP